MSVKQTAIARPNSEAQADEMVLNLIRYYRAIGQIEKATALAIAFEVMGVRL